MVPQKAIGAHESPIIIRWYSGDTKLELIEAIRQADQAILIESVPFFKKVGHGPN